MEKQIDVAVQQTPDHEGFYLVTWFVCDNGTTVAEGTLRYHPASEHCLWLCQPPPTEYEGLLRAEIGRRCRSVQTP